MLCPTLAPTPLIGVIFVCMNRLHPYLAGRSAMGCPLMTPVIPFGFLNVQLASWDCTPLLLSSSVVYPRDLAPLLTGFIHGGT